MLFFLASRWYVANNGGAVLAVSDVDVGKTRVQSYSKPTSQLGNYNSHRNPNSHPLGRCLATSLYCINHLLPDSLFVFCCLFNIADCEVQTANMSSPRSE